MFKYERIVLLISLLLTSVVFSDNLMDGIITAKEIWLSLAVIIILGWLLIKLLSLNSIKVYFNKIDILVILICIYIILNSFFNNTLYIDNTLHRIFLIGIYFAVRNLNFFKNKSTVKQFYYSVFFIAICQIIIALLQVFNVVPTYYPFVPTGLFINPSGFSIFVGSMGTLCFSLFIFQRDTFIRIISLAIFLFAILILAFCSSRASWVAMFITMILSLIYKYNLKIIILGLRTKLLLLIPLFITLSILAFYLYQYKVNSALGRLLIWRVCVNMVVDSPVFGCGPDSFPAKYMFFQADYFINHPSELGISGRLAGNVRNAFNDTLQFVCENGFSGLVILIAIIVLVIRTKKVYIESSYKRSLYISSGFSLVSIIISSFFSYPFSIPVIQIWCMILLAILATPSSSIKTILITKYYIRGTLLCINISIILILLFYTKLKYESFKEWRNLETSSPTTDKRHLNNLLEIAKKNSGLYHYSGFLITLANYYIKNKEFEKAISVLEKAKQLSTNTAIYYQLGFSYEQLKLYAKAEDNYKLVYYAVPNLLKPKYLLALLYMNSSQWEQWELLSREVLNFTPKIESIETQTMKSNISILINTVNDTYQ